MKLVSISEEGFGGRLGKSVRKGAISYWCLDGVVIRLLSMVVRTVLNLVGSVFKLSIGSIKLPKSNTGRSSNRGAGPPAPRWKD